MKSFIEKTFNYDESTHNISRLLNVSYGVDKNFLYGAGVSITSVLKCNRDISFVFHVFTDYVDNEYLTLFEKTAKQFNTHIIIYLIDPQHFLNLPTSQFWSHATYFRVLSFEYLSDICNTLLYLDADVICKGSLAKFTEIKFDDEFAAVIPDNKDMQNKSAERLHWPQIDGLYFNAGVIYINLKKWHDCKLTDYLFTLLRGETEYGLLKYLDQDALNIAFALNNIYLPQEYDKIYTLKNELHDKTRQQYKKIITDSTVLIHYTGITKPWHIWADYPSAQYFQSARVDSPWEGLPLKEARTIAEKQKQYKHYFNQKKYLKGIKSLLNYKLGKKKSKK